MFFRLSDNRLSNYYILLSINKNKIRKNLKFKIKKKFISNILKSRNLTKKFSKNKKIKNNFSIIVLNNNYRYTTKSAQVKASK
jgi:hypothetical protein